MEIVLVLDYILVDTMCFCVFVQENRSRKLKLENGLKISKYWLMEAGHESLGEVRTILNLVLMTTDGVILKLIPRLFQWLVTW